MQATPASIATLILSVCVLVSLPACDPVNTVEEVQGPLPLPAEYQTNRLGESSTTFLRSRANSPIRWQPYSPGICETATDSSRLIFILIGSSLYPSGPAVLDALEGSARITSTINDNYLPVLADVDASRELGIVAHRLSAEIRRPIAFPFIIWLSPDGNPVAWTPVAASDPEGVTDLFEQSSTMVNSMWREAPNYVTENSARDAEMRRQRLQVSDPGASTDPAAEVIVAAQRLCDLFDPSSGTIDGTGGLPPAGVYHLLSLSSTAGSVPSALRENCRGALSASARTLVRSSMVDPLDGGIYLARRGIDWNLPVFTRDTTTQLRMCVALVETWRATGDPALLAAARSALEFAESGLGTAEGRIIHSTSLPPADESAMLWTKEDLEGYLDPAELQALTEVMEIRGLGNVPFDSDPYRRFFRLNVLGMRNTPDTESAPLVSKACRKLLKIRNGRLEGKQIIESACYARHLARAASANASMFSATGETRFRDRAVAHLERVHTDYYDAQSGLYQLPRSESPSQRAARALDYGLTASACLDVHSITLDSKWIRWTEKLIERIDDHFVAGERLLECDPTMASIELQVTDSAMVFGDSSAGVLHAVLSRLSAFVPSSPPRLAAATRAAIGEFSRQPIIHTDMLVGELVRRISPVVHIAPGFGGDDPAAALAETARLAGPQRITIVPIADGFPSPAGLPDRGALLTINGENPVKFSEPAQLAAWLKTHFVEQR